MEKALPCLRALLLTVWTAVGLLVFVGLWQMRTAHLGAKAAAVLDGAQATIAAVNAPCTGFHGSVSCGTLAQVDQTTKNIGIVAGQSALQVKQTGQLVTAAAANLNMVGAHVSSTADALAATATAGRRTLEQATATIAAVQAKLPETQPLVDEATATTADLDKTVRDSDALVESPDVQRFLKGTADTSVQVSGIAADVHKETTKMVAPQPWYRQIYTFGNTGVNVACLITHSCPF